MKTILAWVWQTVAAVRGAFAIKKIVDGPETLSEKIAAVSSELSKVADKFKKLSAETEATWDDDFAEMLKGLLDSIAENLLEELEG